jgi:hypothetical protein
MSLDPFSVSIGIKKPAAALEGETVSRAKTPSPSVGSDGTLPSKPTSRLVGNPHLMVEHYGAYA